MNDSAAGPMVAMPPIGRRLQASEERISLAADAADLYCWDWEIPRPPRHGVRAEAVLISCSCRGNVAFVDLTRFPGFGAQRQFAALHKSGRDRSEADMPRGPEAC